MWLDRLRQRYFVKEKVIRFADPRMLRTKSRMEWLLLTEAGSWESFPPFAEKFARQIGAKIIKREQAVHMRLWVIEVDGVTLHFVYDDFPNGVTIESVDDKGQAVIERLYQLVRKQSAPNGI